MPSAATLGVFALACIALLAIPGPAVLYVLAQSVEHGRRGGLVAVLGIHAGTVVHVAAAALGVSAILASSATAFHAVQYGGAAYLIALGLRRLRSGGSSLEAQAAGFERVFRRGFVVNVLNPKTALFFFAFLPQFVQADRGSAAVQIVLLGSIFIGLGLLSDSAYALVGGTAAAWLRRRPGALRRERYLSAAVYIGLGVATAFAGHTRKS